MTKNTPTSFVLHHDFQNVLDLLTMEERGILITAIFEYAINEDVITDMPHSVKIAFCCIKNVLDRDKQSYMEKCEQNAINGKKGGRPKTERFSEEPKKPYSNSNSNSNNKNNNNSDSNSRNNSNDILPVSDACAPRLDEDAKKYLVEKGIPRGYIDERAERAEVYAKDNGMDAEEVIRKWWQTDRATPPWNGERAYKTSNNTYGFSSRTPQEQAQKTRDAEEWFEARLRKTFGDDA